MQSRVILVPLFKDLSLSSNGTDTALTLSIDVARLPGLLPYAVNLVLYTLTEGAPARNELEWNVQLRSGFDRDHELASPIVPGAAVITADGHLPPVTEDGLGPARWQLIEVKGCQGVGGAIYGPVYDFLETMWTSPEARAADSGGLYLGPSACGVVQSLYLLKNSEVIADCAQWLEDLCKSAPIDCGEVQLPPEDDPDPGEDEAP